MVIEIEVADEMEAADIKRGMERADVRAFVRIVGALEVLPSLRAKRRVLSYVADKFDEDDER